MPKNQSHNELKRYKISLTLTALLSALVSFPAEASLQPDWGFRASQSLEAKINFHPKQKIIVAVIDTGIDILHPLLKNNLWRNPGESGLDAKGQPKSKNGVDDDNNGFVDDVHGFSFAGNTVTLTDHHGHGTHISAIIQGVNPEVQIMSLKYCDPSGNPKENLPNSIRAIRYAIQMGAQIINYSGGGFGASAEEYEALKDAQQKGILIVAAAGNESSNTDTQKYYPASYDLENIISVTALNPDLEVLASSNFGDHSVDIAAPGQNIFSALPSGKSGTMTGTSQATAFVSGAASMILANSPEKLTPVAVIRQLLRTSVYDPKLKGKTKASSRLNTLNALEMKDQDINIAGTKNRNTVFQNSEIFLTDSF